MNPTGTRERWRRPYTLNRVPLPWTETRDTICLPFTTKLSRRNLSQHTWHQYVNKARSWWVETSYSSSTIMLQSKLNHTIISVFWPEINYKNICCTHFQRIIINDNTCIYDFWRSFWLLFLPIHHSFYPLILWCFYLSVCRAMIVTNKLNWPIIRVLVLTLAVHVLKCALLINSWLTNN